MKGTSFYTTLDTDKKKKNEQNFRNTVVTRSTTREPSGRVDWDGN